MIPDLFPMEEWRRLALCAQTDPNLWFPEKGDFKTARRAKRICGRCVVREECLDYALADTSLEGIWGGLSRRERQAARRDVEALAS